MFAAIFDSGVLCYGGDGICVVMVARTVEFRGCCDGGGSSG